MTFQDCLRPLATAELTHSPIVPSLPSCSALVLAGGLGTRLRGIYDGPKCMAPVGGRPFLEYLLRWLRHAGIKDLVMCVGHKREQIEEWLGDGSQHGFCVRYSAEKGLLGTAGAIRLAASMVNAETCLVLNGDSLMELDLAEMYRIHWLKKAEATLALVRVQDASRYGTVQLDDQGKVVAFHANTHSGRSDPGTTAAIPFVNGGIYVIERRLLDVIPAGVPVSLEKQILPRLAGRNLCGFVASGFFIDIGVPADYARAQTELPRRFSL